MTAKFFPRWAWVVLLAAHAYGQPMVNSDDLSDFRGRLVDGGTTSYQGLTVELRTEDNNTVPLRTDVSWDGSFCFYNVPQGDYQVRVLTTSGDEIVSLYVSVGPSAMPFEIHMPGSDGPNPVSGSVSYQELSHPVSKQGRKLLASGQKLFHEQQYDAAAVRFREAVRDDPKSPETHADLGMALASLGKWGDAAGEYRTAVEIDPTNSILHSNLGAALVNLKQYDKAANEAAAALKLDPLNARAHLVIAVALLTEPGHTKDAVIHLESAQKTIPSAKTVLEKVCALNRVEGCP